MKRITILAVLLALLASAVFAETSAFYPVRVDVLKVLTHADGYLVIYRKGSMGAAQAYIPAKWFVPGGKAELVRADDPSYPYMTVFYKDGAFHHLRLYVRTSVGDPSWGVLPSGEGQGKFEAEELKLEF